MSILTRKKIPVHPGQVLNDILAELNLRQSALARHLHVTPATIRGICQGKHGITADMACRLGKAFRTGPEFWLTLQKNWELSRLNATAYESIAAVEGAAA